MNEERALLPLELRARLDVAAASGLVAVDGRLYIVADDELTLHVYDEAGRPLERLALFAGALPADPAERKRRKPDLEALTLLAPGTLLALPSGSTPSRRRAAAVRAGVVSPVDVAPLYLALQAVLPELNLEGAAVSGDRLVLLQRGNGAAGINAVVALDLAGVREAVAAGRPLDGGLVRAVLPVALGALDGVALGFTDATPLPDGRILFAAAAEAGGSTYADGPCAGSIVGVLDGDQIGATWRLPTCDKIEGIHAGADGDGERLTLWLVADADDPSARAPLYRAELTVPRG
jgi:uncharacterized protein DUF6929